MVSRRSDPVPEQAAAVLQYFLQHPSVSDTLYGVARWRLLEETVHRGVDDVRAALAWLVSRGLLLEESTSGPEPVFRANPERIAEAQDLARWLAARRLEDGHDR